MFKKATLRFFAGMLFGSVAGVFLGVGYAGLVDSHLTGRTEIEEMHALLNHVMMGSFFGLAFGGFIALGRKPLVSAFVSVILGAFASYLSIALFGAKPESDPSRLAFVAGAMVLAAVMVELGARIFSSSEPAKNP